MRPEQVCNPLCRFFTKIFLNFCRYASIESLLIFRYNSAGYNVGEFDAMKDLSLIIWLTQLGYSVAFPLAGFTLLAVWLQRKFDLGIWVVLVGISLGLICAIDGFRNSLKVIGQLSKKQKDEDPPPVSFNDHQ